MGKKHLLMVQEFLKTPFWTEVLEPYLEKQIGINSKITALNKDDVERTYIRTNAKRSVYQGIKNAIENEWPNEKTNKNQEV